MASDHAAPSIVLARAGTGNVYDDSAPALAGPTITRTDRVLAKGETLMDVLLAADVHRAVADSAIKAAGRHVNLRKLRIGQTIEIYRLPSRSALVGLIIPGEHGDSVVVSRHDNGFRGQPLGLSAARALFLSIQASNATGSTADARDVRLRRGETLIGALRRAGMSYGDAESAASVIGQQTDLRRLQIGQPVSVTFAGGNKSRPIGVTLVQSGRRAEAGLWPDGRFRKGPARLGETPTAEPVTAEDEAEIDALAEIAPSAGPTFSEPIDHGEEMHVLRVTRGDTLSGLLERAGAPDTASHSAIISLRQYYDSNRLRLGQRLVVRLSVKDDVRDLEGFVIEAGSNRAIVIERAPNRRFIAHRTSRDALMQAIRTAEVLAAAQITGDRSPAAARDRETDEAAVPDVTEVAANERKRLTVVRGSTLMETLVKAGCPRKDAHEAIAALRKLFNPRKVRAGQGLTVALVEDHETAVDGNPALRLAAISLDLGPDKQVQVVRDETGGYVSGVVTRELAKTHRRVGSAIDSSLYAAADKAGLPNDVLMELIRLFSYDVDFQRHIQKGDAFELLFEQMVDDSGAVARNGDILYAAMTLSGGKLALYRHTLDDGFTDYFDENGQSVRKALMRTPIDGARLTSGFGMRKHPTMGYNKMHRGVDFGAPRGTPIFAAGNGVVDAAGRDGAYGNRVRLRHGPEFKTLYAHLNKFAKGITQGAHVRQGQVIGYVGSTGRSTGPHLHYEVWRNDKRVNPLDVKLPTGFALTGGELTAYQSARDSLNSLFATLDPASTVAANPADLDTYAGAR